MAKRLQIRVEVRPEPELDMTVYEGVIEEVEEVLPPAHRIDFWANFDGDPGYPLEDASDWRNVFADAIAQGVTVQCLEQNTGVTARQFQIAESGQLRMFMPAGSFGMGHRCVILGLGVVHGPVNVAWEFMVEDAGTNLFVNGGGKYGGAATQYGAIQSGPTGGIRLMPTWPSGASVLGKQDLTFSIQDQRDGKQWLQPPYYGHRPIETNRWYRFHTRMTGGSELEPTTIRCQFQKDDDPPFDYIARTTNHNAVQGHASVSVELTSFFGGGESAAAPADAYFRTRDFHVWVEE